MFFELSYKKLFQHVSKIFIVTIFSSCLNFTAFSQFPATSFGIKAGYGFSCISKLDKTILSESYFVNYTLKKQNTAGMYVGVFYNQSILNSPRTEAENDNDKSSERRWLIQAHIAFARQGSELLFNNYEKDFSYKMVFDYSYVLAGCDMKYYFFGKETGSTSKWRRRFKGLNAGMGLELGVNISPDKITYTSWGTGREPVFDPDLQEQKKLRDVLKGKTIWGLNVIAGYNIITTKGENYVNPGISIEARMFLGLNDAVETRANPYNFIEKKNMNVVCQLLIGIDLHKIFKKR